MQRSTFSAPVTPPRFQRQAPKQYLVQSDEPKIIYSTPYHPAASNVVEPHYSPVSPQSETSNSSHRHNTCPMSITSSLPSKASATDLRPGPLKSLFYVSRQKLEPVCPTKYVPYFLPCSHPRKDGDPFHSIWTADRIERETLRATTQYHTQSAFSGNLSASSLLRRQRLDDLRRRLLREENTIVRVGNASLSSTVKTIEEATASRHTDNRACIATLGIFLTGLIRDFSPRYSPAEVVPHIIHWVDMKAQNDMTRSIRSWRAGRWTWNAPMNGAVEDRKMERMIAFSPLKMVLLQTIKEIWEPEKKEKHGKRFLTYHEYLEATDRLLLGLPVDDVTADLLLRTMKGIDALKLFALLLEPECVAGEDVGVLGLTLARDCIHDGYSFALYSLYGAAGDKLCRVGAEGYACEAMDIATTVMEHNSYKFEDLEFFMQTCYIVECYRLSQRRKWKAGVPKDGSFDLRPPRKDAQREKDVEPFFQRYTALLKVL